MVDNPFNLLTSVKSGYWKSAKLFVTDHSFIEPLKDTGARWVEHLPLAASPHFFETHGQLPPHAHDIEDALVFVGRSEFPDKDKFFAGIHVDPTLMRPRDATTPPPRFDYFWWRKHLRNIQLWPGNQVRHIGAGAEMASMLWKNDCLTAAGDITIFGDDGWTSIDTADTRPVVDYYAHLPAIYRTASVTLNVTGMQLPAGLTQRHFDVWCAGGFLISDATPGLNIFPKELVEQITYSRPEEIRKLFARYHEETPAKKELRSAWRDCIRREHTYAHRVARLLNSLNF
nr:glycosyltransferase [Pseudodesulfovibrio sp. JC047]